MTDQHPPTPDEIAACAWKADEDGILHTDCGHEFVFTDDPPHDWVKFCCYCGKPFKECAYDELAAIAEEDE